MPDSPLNNSTASTINAVGQVVDTGVNSLFQFLTNKSQKKFAVDMYNRQRADALSDWNRQNVYNSPEQQMQRLRDAGLNPNLVYGHGADAMSTSPVRSSSPGSYSPKAPVVDVGDATRNSLMMYYDMETKKATIDNLKAQNDAIKNRAALDAVNAKVGLATIPLRDAEAANRVFDVFMKGQLAPGSLEMQRSQIQNVQARTTATLDANERAEAMLAPNLQIAAQKVLNMRLDALKTQMDTAKSADERKYIQAQTDMLGSKQYQVELMNRALEYDNKLRDSGINPHSSSWLSALGRLFQDDSANSDNRKFQNKYNIGVQGSFNK